MRALPRIGLLFATVALPLGAVLTSLVLGERPAPRAPDPVRVGELRARANGDIGQPATLPSPTGVRPVVVGERATPTGPASPADVPAGSGTSGPAGSAEVQPSMTPGADPADAKGRAKGRSGTGHPTPSHGPTPGVNGSGG